MPRRPACACVLCAVAAALIAWLTLGPVSSASAQPPAGKPVSFIDDVAPILKESCFACHDAKKKSGKYDMTSVEKLLAGGSNGEPVVAGKPGESDFYDLIVTDDKRRMPPRGKGEAVPKDKAAVIERWIKEGAKADAGLAANADIVKELRVRWKPPVPPETYPYPAVVNALAFTPDGKSLVVGGHHELTVWAVPAGKLTKRVRTRAERAYAVTFLPDGTLAVAGGRPGQEGDVRVYDLSQPGRTENGVAVLDGVGDPNVLRAQLLDADDTELCLAVSPDGKKLAAGGTDRTVRVWDISGGAAAAKLQLAIESHSDWVLGVAYTADGKYLISAGRDKTAKAWDVAAKESVTTFPGHQNVVYGVASGNDAALGYSVGADAQLRSWKPGGDGKQVKNVGGHNGEVFKIAASPQTAVLATASADKTVRLWDAAKLAATKTLSGLTDYVFAVGFSPDGSFVAGGSYDGEVRVWTVADGKQVAAFNASPGYAAAKAVAVDGK